MKVVVSKKAFAETLAHVERIVPSRSPNPTLNLVRIDVSDGTMQFSGTNLDIDIRASIPADVIGEGSYAVASQMLGQVVRALPGDTVELTFTDKDLELVSGTYTSRLQLSEPSTAATLEFETEYPGSIGADQLRRILTSVKYAAAVADFQAVFRGVKFELNNEHTRAVATDGFRLAYYHLPHSTGIESEFLVSGRSIDELIRLLTDGDVSLALSAGQLHIQYGDFTLNMKLMDGNLPDYNRVIPVSFPVSVTLNATLFADAVSRVSLMADKNSSNRVDLFVSGGEIQITAEGTYGQSREALEVVQEGDGTDQLMLAYNARYLLDALGPVRDEVRLLFSGPNTAPTVINDPSDESYFAMVVPLRTS